VTACRQRIRRLKQASNNWLKASDKTKPLVVQVSASGSAISKRAITWRLK